MAALDGEDADFLREFPFFSSTAPGLPRPGKNFLAVATALAEGVTDEEATQHYFDSLELAGQLNAVLGGRDKSTNVCTIKKRDVERHRKLALQEKIDDQLSLMYLRSLYDDEFALPVNLDGRRASVQFLLGHQWGYEVDGPRRSEVMVIGKNPGREEGIAKANFVGPSSDLFREVLRQVGLHDVDKWYMTNVVRFVNPAINTSGNIPAAWVNDCLPVLWEEIKIVRPKYILALGAEAISAVLGKGKNRKSTIGSVHTIRVPLHDVGEDEEYLEVKVITSTHPAAVMHEPANRILLEQDLAFFKRSTDITVSADFKDPEADKEHLVITKMDELEKLVNRMKQEHRFEYAIDCEWDGSNPADGKLYTSQFSWEEKKAAVVVWRDEKGDKLFDAGEEAGFRALRDIWIGPDVRIIGHYFAADLLWLKAYGLPEIQRQFDVEDDDPDPDGVERLFGWQKTKTRGGFDTILAAHAHEETADFGLKDLAVRYTTAGNYDVELNKWLVEERARLRKETGNEKADVPGFGRCPRDILWKYAGLDADVTFRLYRLYNDQFLDKDRLGNSCREAFWRSMWAFNAFYEIHEVGMPVNKKEAAELYELYSQAVAVMLAKFREDIGWNNDPKKKSDKNSRFNPNSTYHCREFLFGEQFSGRRNKTTGEMESVRPAKAYSLYLEPYKTSGKRPKLWSKVVARKEEANYNPSTDKEVLSVYQHKHPFIKALLDIKFLSHTMKQVLKPPTVIEEDDENEEDIEFEDGMFSFLWSDGCIHTHMSQTKETRRASSWAPPMQNLGSRREEDYAKILKERYKAPIRSIFEAPPGWVFLSNDYTGAELLMMAVQAGDVNMIDHCRRALLPESHKDYYDIHSGVAVDAFRLCDAAGHPLRPLKSVLKKEGHGAKRDAAKPVVFGYAYGMTAESAWRKALEASPQSGVTIEDAAKLILGLERKYPALPPYFRMCEERVESHGWLMTCFGGYRRAYASSDEGVLAAQKREFRNCPIQGGVADAMSMAMGNLWRYRIDNPEMRYKICMQIHDDVVLMVPVEQAVFVADKVVPLCMTEKVDIWPCDLDGNVRPDPNAPYKMVPGLKIQQKWGIPLKSDSARKSGLYPKDLVDFLERKERESA